MEDETHPSKLDGILKKIGFWKALAFLLLFAFILRVTLLLLWSPVISRDSVFYLQIGHQYSQGEFKKALKGAYPPGYPLVIHLFLKGGFSSEMAGRAASLLAGLLSLVFVVFLLLPLGKKWALLGGFLLSIQPYELRYSVMVLSESTYCAALLGAWCFFVRGLSSGKKSLFLGSSLCLVYSYLTRPEGILILLFFSGWTLFSRQISGWKKRGTVILLLWSVSLFLIFPYLIWLKALKTAGVSSTQGRWKITQKGGFREGLKVLFTQKKGGKTIEKFNPAALPQFGWRALKNFAKNFLRMAEISHPLFFFLALMALVLNLPPPWREIKWALGAFILCQLTVISLVRVDSRLVLQPSLMACFLALLGLYSLSQRWPGHYGRGEIGIVFILLLSTLPIGMRPLGTHKIYLRESGEWIRKQGGGPSMVLATQDVRMGFYTGAKKTVYLNGPKQPFSSEEDRKKYFNNLFALAEFYKASWVALDKRLWKGEKNWGNWKWVRTFKGLRNLGICLWKRR